ncbi:uncharacterized protein [Coffea arabica]|uniref:RNase H type-1 domain-containing protein n=1 Tax=Coffea arabica TaxID=13443 RepID=A0ABM4UFM5_COFAR
MHLLSTAVIPKAVFRAIERTCANFLWGASKEGSSSGPGRPCGFPSCRQSIVEAFILAKRSGHWDAHLLAQFLPRDMMSFVLGKPVPTEHSTDEVVWMLESFEKFSLASAYHEVRHVGNASVMLSRVWQRPTPVKVSFFMVQLLMGRLPLDDVLCTFGFHVPSKCVCCLSPAAESIEHVFATGKVAMAIWAFFGSLCGISSIVPNRAVFEGIQPHPPSICQDIFLETTFLLEGQFKQYVGAWLFLQLCDWSSQSGQRFEIKLVCWEPAVMGALTLNTDGCSRSNLGPCGGRGVLQDPSGCPLVGFSAFLEVTFSFQVETLALLMGLRICVQKGFTNVSIQLDSLVLVGILQLRLHYPWHIRLEVRQIWKLAGDPPRLFHYFREANKVTDTLANVGVAHPHHAVKLYEHWNEWPRLACGGISLDSMGAPSVRRVRTP